MAESICEYCGKKISKGIYCSKSCAAKGGWAAKRGKVDADNKQEELDGVLKEIWEDDIQTFYQRYPYIKKLGYDKPQKGWVD